MGRLLIHVVGHRHTTTVMAAEGFCKLARVFEWVKGEKSTEGKTKSKWVQMYYGNVRLDGNRICTPESKGILDHGIQRSMNLKPAFNCERAWIYKIKCENDSEVTYALRFRTKESASKFESLFKQAVEAVKAEAEKKEHAEMEEHFTALVADAVSVVEFSNIVDSMDSQEVVAPTEEEKKEEEKPAAPVEKENNEKEVTVAAPDEQENPAVEATVAEEEENKEETPVAACEEEKIEEATAAETETNKDNAKMEETAT